MTPKSIDEFRTAQYRVFSANPYFSMNLEKEMKWHDRHLKKLEKHKKNPSGFHREQTSHRITHDRFEHFKEQVIEAIPFHRQRRDLHQKRLQTIQSLVPKRTYKKLVKISEKTGGLPEFFVFDKKSSSFFFVANENDEQTRQWMKRAKRVADVIIVGR